MDVSVVVVNWNRQDLLQGCLRSVYENSGRLGVEVFVVDNASTDGGPEMVTVEFPEARLIRNRENLGFSKANNQAIRATLSRYVLLLNNDAYLLPGSLEKMVGFMDSHPEVGALGPRLLNDDGSLQPSTGNFPTLGMVALNKLIGKSRLAARLAGGFSMQHWSYDRLREVDTVTAACMMIRREALDEVGLLDEDIFMYHEETDLCYRMKKASWKIYFYPDAEAVHLLAKGREERSDYYPRQYLHCQTQLYFYRKHYSKATVGLYRLARRTAIALSILMVSLTGRGEEKEKDLSWLSKILEIYY
jgi:GT2 family glycosyltransferase